MSSEKLLYYDFDEYRLDVVNGQLLKGGKPINLTPKSLEILLFLIQNRGRLLKKKEILDSLWSNTFVEESNLIQQIYMLRKVLKQNGKKEVPIETIPKTGYRFNGEVKEVCEEEKTDGFSIDTAVDSFPKDEEEISKSSQTAIISQFRTVKTSGFSKHYYSAIILILLVFIVFLAPWYFYSRNSATPAKINSIAVLPFQQINGESEDKLGLGMADLLIAELGKLEDIQITPTSSIIRYAGSEDLNLFEIGSNLKVDTVLWGTIQRNQETVRINYQLYSVRDKRPLFSWKIDEKFTNIFSLQDKISEQVFQQLSLKIKNGQETALGRQYTKNTEAFELYSKGLFYWSNRTTKGKEQAVTYFEEAIQRDPAFVLAYAYLADTYSLAFYNLESINSVSGNELSKKAKENAQKALDLDPNCAEAMIALAVIYHSERKDIEAFNLLQKAIEIKPNSATAHQRIGWLFAVEGNLEKAIEKTKIALNIDPQNQAPNISLASYMNLLRQPDEALIYCQKALEIDPKSKIAKEIMGEALEQKGLFDEAILKFQEINAGVENDFEDIDNIIVLISLSRIYAKKGDFEKANNYLQKVLTSNRSKEVSFLTALALISLDKDDKGMDILEKIITSHDKKFFLQLTYNYNLDQVRQNPRFVSLLRFVEQK